MPTQPRVQVKKSRNAVYLVVNGQETEMSWLLAKETGEALFKAGCDVKDKQQEKKK